MDQTFKEAALLSALFALDEVRHMAEHILCLVVSIEVLARRPCCFLVGLLSS